MQILATRKRVSGTLPHYEYRLFVPFDQLSEERQRLIHYRTDFGTRQGLHARLADVIAPIEYLRMPPGPAAIRSRPRDRQHRQAGRDAADRGDLPGNERLARPDPLPR